jgi:hypothetical protein
MHQYLATSYRYILNICSVMKNLGEGRRFSLLHRSALGPTHPPVKCVPRLFSGSNIAKA